MEGAKHAESSDGIYDLRSENFQPATAGFSLFFFYLWNSFREQQSFTLTL